MPACGSSISEKKKKKKKKALDRQILFLPLSTRGNERLDAAAEHDFKSRLDTITLGYDPLAKTMVLTARQRALFADVHLHAHQRLGMIPYIAAMTFDYHSTLTTSGSLMKKKQTKKLWLWTGGRGVVSLATLG